MLHTGSCDATGVGVEALPKLVEMNTIAAAFIGMSPEIANIHRYICGPRICDILAMLYKIK